MPKQVPRAGAHIMIKTAAAAAMKTPGNGGAMTEKNPGIAMKVIPSGPAPVQEEKKPEEIKPVPELRKEMTLAEKILKVENLQLIVEKRGKLVQTRSELERFQIASNDFNCSMRLNDSDGNVFTTNFTPGIKKVIEFLKSSFDASIADVERKITF